MTRFTRAARLLLAGSAALGLISTIAIAQSRGGGTGTGTGTSTGQTTGSADRNAAAQGRAGAAGTADPVVVSGRGTGTGGRRGAAGPGGFATLPVRARLTTLSDTFTLDDAQRKQIKAILDADHKSAEPLRESIVKAREALGAAIEAGVPAAEMEPLVKAYAGHAAAMMHAETRALARVVKVLTPGQIANQPAVDATFFIMRGALFDKKWDSIPGGRGY